GRPLGAFALGFSDTRSFDPDLRRYVDSIGDQATQAFERVRLLETEHAAQQDLRLRRAPEPWPPRPDDARAAGGPWPHHAKPAAPAERDQRHPELRASGDGSPRVPPGERSSGGPAR